MAQDDAISPETARDEELRVAALVADVKRIEDDLTLARLQGQPPAVTVRLEGELAVTQRRLADARAELEEARLAAETMPEGCASEHCLPELGDLLFMVDESTVTVSTSTPAGGETQPAPEIAPVDVSSPTGRSAPDLLPGSDGYSLGQLQQMQTNAEVVADTLSCEQRATLLTRLREQQRSLNVVVSTAAAARVAMPAEVATSVGILSQLVTDLTQRQCE